MTSQLICSANQLAGFYLMATLVFNELTISTNALFLTGNFRRENHDYLMKKLKNTSK